MAVWIDVNGRREDPFVAFTFDVFSMDGTIPRGAVAFSEVRGLKDETAVINYRSGIDTYDRKVPGRTTVQNLTLVRGLDHDRTMRNWRKLCKEDASLLQGSALPSGIRKDIVVVQTVRGTGSTTGHDIRKWICYNAWPCSLEVADHKGDSDDIVLETMELAFEMLDEEDGELV